MIDQRPGEAIALFTWALDLLRAGDPNQEIDPIIGRLLQIIGCQEYFWGDQERGKEKVRESLSILRKLSHPHLAYTILYAVEIKAYGPEYDYAPMLRESQDIYRANNSDSIVSALTRSGEYALDQGDYDQAKTYFLEALNSFQEYDRRELAWIFFGLGRVAEGQEAYLSALDYLQKSAALFKEIGRSVLYGVVNNHLGNVYYALKQYKTAIHYYQQFLEVSKKTEIPWRKAQANTYLGRTMLMMGDLHKAEKYLLKAKNICENANDKIMLGFLLADLGLLAFTKGNLRPGIEHYLSALHNQWDNQTIQVKHYTMVRTIPLLERVGHTILAGKMVAFILAYPIYNQIPTLQPARDFLEKLRAELPEEDCQTILEEGKSVEMEDILAELEKVLQDAKQDAI